MIKGIEIFKKYFKGHEEQYVIIGGTACDILMSKEGLDFRATKDFDIVLIVEMLDRDFGKKFWSFVKDGGYEYQKKSTGKPEFYRFTNPKNESFPIMIELFSRKPNTFLLEKESTLSPLPIDEEISSLSAILLDDEYYSLLKRGKTNVDGVSLLDAVYLMPFKMKAWLDLTNEKRLGKQIDDKKIKKHKNDVFRLSELLIKGNKVVVSKTVYEDIIKFLLEMGKEEINLKQLGIFGKTKEQIIEDIKSTYVLKNT